MALLTWPSGILVTSSSLELVTGDAAYESGVSDTVTTLRRRAGRWAGQTDFGLEELSSATVRAVEAFLAALDGALNVSEVPIHRPTPPTVPAGLEVSSTAFSDGQIETTMSAALTDVAVGQYLRVGNRLRVITAVVSGTVVVLSPQVADSAGVSVEAGATVRASRAPGSRTILPRTPDFAGPWTLEWVERI